ncbi:MAG: TraR/DksA C4-type zinc finger protein [Candidatus Eiseniibacteriota bacterium]|nr:MAG: TraR/DksA C4-type zinc finger protein [Candidatus Eisenbacteria bacterium]
MNKKDLKHFEQRLMEERNKLLVQLAHVEKDVLGQTPRDSAGDLSAYTFHMADLGTDAMEREKAFLFASSEGRLLYHINEALRRLYRNEYGDCESCGSPISRERLEVVPHARLCIKCKEKEEKAAKGK